ncbi:hypothetical protein ACS0TY_005223 [Phlomoides rotata]
MTKIKSSVIGRRAWRLLRMARLWARKGGLRVAVVLMRKLGDSNESRRALVYGDREFSFDDTPIVRVKMHRPSSSSALLRFKIPCIEPPLVDFDCDFGGDEEDSGMWRDEDEEGEGIDERAEKFIAHFYQQMKLQTQRSSYGP